MQDTVIDGGKDPAAKALGAMGCRKRAENMMPERWAEIARAVSQKDSDFPAQLFLPFEMHISENI